jgi:hypothetical protein
MLIAGFCFSRGGEKINNPDGDGPADGEVEIHYRKTQYGGWLIENLEKGKVEHNISQYKKYNPGFPQLEPFQNLLSA